MSIRWWFTRLAGVAVILAALLPAQLAWAQFGSTPTDGLRLPEMSVSVREDALALELNPAGLATIDGFDGQVVFTSAEDDLLSGTGVFLGYGGLGPIGLGTSLQYVENPTLGGNFKKFSLGLAVQPYRLISLGLAYNFFDSDVDIAVDEFSSWDVGLQVRLAEWLGVAGTVRNFNTPRLGGQPLDPRYTLGSALRFFEGRFRVELEAAYESGPEDWLLRARILGEPVAGLTVFAETHSTPVDDFDIATLQGGLGFAFGQAAIATAVVAQFDDNAELTGTATALRAVSRPLRTILEPEGIMASITVSGALPERGRQSLILPDQRSFLDLLVYLDDLSHDEHVAGLVLHLENVSLGLAQHWELRRGLSRLRERGKEVVVHLGTADFGDVYLASAADVVYLSPGTALFPAGLTSTLTYLGDLFDNVGITPEFVRIGEYKSAAEALTESSPSAQTLEAVNAWLDDAYNTMIEAIAQGRELSADDVRAVVDGAPLSPSEATDRGMVDGVCFQDELRERLAERAGHSVRLVTDYDPRGWRDYRWTPRPRIAVVYVDGDIVQGGSGSFPIVGQTTGHRTLVRVLEGLRESRRVRAVVLRVDSPGGSAWASEAIWRAVERVDEQLPVVVSMGNVAASGGYYVAAPGREIFATELTLTGSIGVFSGHFSADQLFDWAGINRIPLTRGATANIFGIEEPWTERQRTAVERDVELMYQVFLERVAAGRGVEPSDIDPIARGRIWSGRRALEHGLVDQYGGLIDAIERARELAGLEPDTRVELVSLPQRSLFGAFSLLGVHGTVELTDSEMDALAAVLGALGLDRVLRIPMLYGDGRPATRMAFELEGLE